MSLSHNSWWEALHYLVQTFVASGDSWNDLLNLQKSTLVSRTMYVIILREQTKLWVKILNVITANYPTGVITIYYNFNKYMWTILLFGYHLYDIWKTSDLSSCCYPTLNLDKDLSWQPQGLRTVNDPKYIAALHNKSSRMLLIYYYTT